MINGFDIDKLEIDNIFKIYQQRRSNEEIEYINSTHKGLDGLAKKLKSDLNTGISSNTLEARREAFDNTYRYREPMPSFWFFVKDAFGDEILQILCLCAIIEISIGLSPFTENPGYDAFDGIGIVFAIMVIVITTAVTNYNKEKKFKQLSDENFKKFQVVVTRDGANINLSDEELLVGDKCKIDMGMIIPADGIVINSSNLKLDEASLTGESNLMRKESIENYLKNLEKRRNDGIRKINEKKRQIFFEDYFNLNKFQRDYSCFSYDTSQENLLPTKFHISENINLYHMVKRDKDFSRINDDFPLKKVKKVNNNNIYLFPTRKSPINYTMNKINKRKKLARVGSQIISKNIYK